MKTARERAVKEMVGLWIGDEIQSQPVESEDAEALLDLIESAGLAIVDAELFAALVAAVWAEQWARTEQTVLSVRRAAGENWMLPSVEANIVSRTAHARAVELLAERGE